MLELFKLPTRPKTTAPDIAMVGPLFRTNSKVNF